jgi:hypothetical protein
MIGRRSFLKSLGLGGGALLVGQALPSETWPFRKIFLPSVETVVKVNYVNSKFSELLAPGLRDVFMSYLTSKSDWYREDSETLTKNVEFNQF